MNTLTEEVFWCCRVTPYLFEYGGLPYVVPYGTDLEGALSFLPRGAEKVSCPTNIEENKNKQMIGGLDAWL